LGDLYKGQCVSIPDGSPQDVAPAPSQVSNHPSDGVSDDGRPLRLAAGGSRTKVRFWITGGVALTVLVALGALNGFLTTDHPAALNSLPPRSCFRLPSQPDRPVTGTSDVVRVACTEQHYGEVIAQPAIDLNRAGTADRVVAARKACREPFADYNPDFWALPANVALEVVPPERAGPQGPPERHLPLRRPHLPAHRHPARRSIPPDRRAAPLPRRGPPL
jgi:hypothetical protein